MVEARARREGAPRGIVLPFLLASQAFRRWPRAFAALFAFLATFVSTGNAWALAPMCGEDASSIEAPPPLYPSDGATLDACSEADPSMELGLPLREGPSKAKVSVDFDLAVLSSPSRVPKATSTTHPLPDRERPRPFGLDERPERPPRDSSSRPRR